MHEVKLIICESVKKVSELMRIHSEVEVSHHSSDILAVQVVVSSINIPHAPVGVVVTIRTSTEGSIRPFRIILPMVVVMAKAIHFRIRLAVEVRILLFSLFPLLLNSLGLLHSESLQFPILTTNSFLIPLTQLWLSPRLCVTETNLGLWLHKRKLCILFRFYQVSDLSFWSEQVLH